MSLSELRDSHINRTSTSSNELNSVPVLEVRREVVVHEVVVALVVRDEGVVEVSGGIVHLGLLSLPTCTNKYNLGLPIVC